LLLVVKCLQALIPLKGAVDTAVCPAAAKAAIRDRIAALTKRCLEAAKAAAAANKEAAAAAAMAAADAAVEAGKSVVVLQLQVRLQHVFVVDPNVLVSVCLFGAGGGWGMQLVSRTRKCTCIVAVT
jgi:hypothetical protein